MTPQNPPATNLTPRDLNVEKEGTYFAFVLVISLIVWLLLIISMVGIFYAALFALIAWIGSGLLTAYLRAESIRVDAQQMPQLHATFLKVCDKLGVATPPKLFVLQAGGTLNAFATRFAGRDFVVVFSDMLEAFGPESAEIQFVLGHELGHLKSKHIIKRMVLAPGIFFPLIGPAYLRACETSCDRYGAYVADNLDGAVRAMVTLSGGKQKDQPINAELFASQHREERGFFISWHELSSTYPTLSQRTAQLLALRDPVYSRQAPRNPFAYLFALATPGGQFGTGGANMLVFIVIIGLLAAMAIPAFAKVRDNANQKVCYNNTLTIQAAYESCETQLKAAPTSFEQFIGPGKVLEAMPKCPKNGDYEVQSKEGGGCEVVCSAHGDDKPSASGSAR